MEKQNKSFMQQFIEKIEKECDVVIKDFCVEEDKNNGKYKFTLFGALYTSFLFISLFQHYLKERKQ